MSILEKARTCAVMCAIALGLAACNKSDRNLIDASSQEALLDSVDKIRVNLTDRAELDQLDVALADVARFSIDPQLIMEQAAKGRMPTKEEAFRTVKPLVDNLSKDELLVLAGKLRQNYTTQLATYDKQLAELRRRQKAAEEIGTKMSNFTVIKADYANASASLSEAAGSLALRLKLTVQNNLDVPVSKAVMMVNFGPDGSLTPWLSQRVEKQFDKPLLPGQTADLEVFSYFSGVAKGAEEIKPVLDAAMLELTGADGKVFLSAPKWQAGDITQLNLLEAASAHIRGQLAMTATGMGSTRTTQ
ncbi:hypothetical protein [Xanthomonas vesicatoria]|uniref:Lipoprotein n=1 Tax=Xanthomonas vesicatoria TaxID=56460 RepID=A0ABS8L3Z1_9XANT|nr:hypothetical protein [Xanthomonas vesicatoria]MCC8620457.1 hypothetical protein [Xanthomonas vesicatoria]MCC8630171.1 hypothetical protein [Xanthomonas vesicatoria]MDG4491527.1 hypothetical protein [Xanthomonas vesicatoria]